MSHDETDKRNSNMVEPRHEVDDGGHLKGVEGKDDVSTDREGSAPDSGGQVSKRACESALEADGEYVDAVPADPQDAAFFSMMSWRGELPRPEDFAKYPAAAQDAILEMAMRRLEMEEKTVEAAINLDMKESERQDEIVRSSTKQSADGLLYSAILDALLILGAVVSFCLTGEVSAVIAILTGLGAINLIPAIFKGRTKSKAAEPPDGTDEAKKDRPSNPKEK